LNVKFKEELTIWPSYSGKIREKWIYKKKNKESLFLAIVEFTCQTCDLGACFWKSRIDLMFQIPPHAWPMGAPTSLVLIPSPWPGRKADLDELGT
jgi:hypothetical protein